MSRTKGWAGEALTKLLARVARLEAELIVAEVRRRAAEEELAGVRLMRFKKKNVVG